MRSSERPGKQFFFRECRKKNKQIEDTGEYIFFSWMKKKINKKKIRPADKEAFVQGY